LGVFGGILRVFWGYFGDILGVFWGNFREFWGYFGGILGNFEKFYNFIFSAFKK
jgi:hypothetical protein